MGLLVAGKVLILPPLWVVFFASLCSVLLNALFNVVFTCSRRERAMVATALLGGTPLARWAGVAAPSDAAAREGRKRPGPLGAAEPSVASTAMEPLLLRGAHDPVRRSDPSSTTAAAAAATTQPTPFRHVPGIAQPPPAPGTPLYFMSQGSASTTTLNAGDWTVASPGAATTASAANAQVFSAASVLSDGLAAGSSGHPSPVPSASAVLPAASQQAHVLSFPSTPDTLQLSPVAPTAPPLPTSPLSNTGARRVVPPQAPSPAAPGPSIGEVLRPVKEAAKKQAGNINRKIVLHSVVYVTNRHLAGVAALKSLLVLVVLNYVLDMEGGWRRYVTLNVLGFGFGQLTCFAQHVLACAAPSEHRPALVNRGWRVKIAEEGLTWSTLDAIVDNLLGGLSSLPSVLYQNLTFVQVGCAVAPAFVTHCVPGLICFFWVFAAVAAAARAFHVAVASRFKDNSDRNEKVSFLVWILHRTLLFFALVACLQTALAFGVFLYKKDRYFSVLEAEMKLRTAGHFWHAVEVSWFWKLMLVSLFFC